MAGEEGNTEGQNKSVENQVPANGSNNPVVPPQTPTPTPPPAQKFPEPEILDAVVNSDEKPNPGPTGFRFSTPKRVHDEMAKPTKGDLAHANQPPPASPQPKKTLADLDAEIASDQRADKDRTIDDYIDTATMFIEGWEALLTFAARMISKDHSDSPYEFSAPKKQRLIDQATKVSRKRDWVMPIEYLFVGTLLPASAGILLKAQDKRKEYIKRMENAPEGTEKEITKGGPNKGFEKRRSPGRPRK